MSQFVFLTILDAASPYDALEHSWAYDWHFSTNVLSGSAHSQAEELRLGGEPPASSRSPLQSRFAQPRWSSCPWNLLHKNFKRVGFTMSTSEFWHWVYFGSRGVCVTRTVRIGWFRTAVRCEIVIHKCTCSACENNNSRRTRQQIERQRPA